MKILIKAIPAIMLGIGLFAAAQDKVGYVNMNKAFEEFHKTLNANVIFEQKKAEYDDKMNILRNGVDDAIRELKAVEADTKNELLGQAAREEAQRKYRVRLEVFGTKREEFERAKQNGYQELRKIQAEAEESLVEELKTVLKKFSADNGYTHIFDVSGQSMNRLPILLVYPEQQDITAAFIKVCNTGKDKDIATAKAKLDAIKKDAQKSDAK